MDIDVKPTVETIENIADRMRRYADNLNRIAQTMQKTNNLEYASEAMQEIKNCFANLRTDLLVSRPSRAYEKALRIMEHKNTNLIEQHLADETALEAMKDRDFDKNG